MCVHLRLQERLGWSRTARYVRVDKTRHFSEKTLKVWGKRLGLFVVDARGMSEVKFLNFFFLSRLCTIMEVAPQVTAVQEEVL